MTRTIRWAAALAFAFLGCSSTNEGGAGGTGGAGGGAHADCFDPKPGCVVPTDATRNENPSVSADDRAALSLGNANFALDIGRQLASPTNNVVYSPYSISTALAMTYAGARTTTEQAMGTTLHFTLPQDRLHPTFDDLDLQLESRAQSDVQGGGLRLHTANAIWAKIGLSFEADFLTILAEYYGAHVRLADFSDPPAAEGLINTWVSDQTEGKIPHLLNNNIEPDTVTVLVNAIYFDAPWATPFDKASTKSGTFVAGDGQSRTVDMMRGGQDTLYGTGDGWEAVEIPYAGTPISMLVVMPAAGTADAFTQSLDSAALDAITSSMTEHTVDLTMPKFSFASGASLKDTLTALGMGVAFSELADFSGIAAGGGLLIQDVIHKAIISVDENGTEAAAATAVIIGTTGAGTFPPPATMVLNHPFLFFIRDQPTGAILFGGRVNDPSGQ